MTLTKLRSIIDESDEVEVWSQKNGESPRMLYEGISRGIPNELDCREVWWVRPAVYDEEALLNIQVSSEDPNNGEKLDTSNQFSKP